MIFDRIFEERFITAHYFKTIQEQLASGVIFKIHGGMTSVGSRPDSTRIIVRIHFHHSDCNCNCNDYVYYILTNDERRRLLKIIGAKGPI